MLHTIQVAALGEAVCGLGLALDGGKDSLSMAVSCPTTDKQDTVTVPSPPTVRRTHPNM